MGVPTLSSIPLIFLLLFPLIILSAEEEHKHPKNCTNTFPCGTNGQTIQFPLFNKDTHPNCGLIPVNCKDRVPVIYLGWSSWNYLEFQVEQFFENQTAKVLNLKLQDFINSSSCETFKYLYYLRYPPKYISYSIYPSIDIFICDISNISLATSTQQFFNGNYYSYGNCTGSMVYYMYRNRTNHEKYPSTCIPTKFPVKEGKTISKNIFSLLENEFTLGWKLTPECEDCHRGGGICTSNSQDFHCIREKGKTAGKEKRVIILATAILGCAILTIMAMLTIMAILTIRYRKKWKDASNYISSRDLSLDPSSKSDHEGGVLFFGIPVFSYAELEEATNNFDSSRELGDGGFGTVYHGKLRDGREVAVKRLYEHNYRRLTQFRNEIEILTRIHHKNLVTLYGCTSGQGRELLLVYEYISNGTVADHLHGHCAKDEKLTWPIRINIAIETASALAYLHNSDIIHRDVKTNNILLHNNFGVKVADFGLSRLFPNDVTHVSTAPQGTPGYVDPEYHQCYQLTDKSDVYSFGVVLIELVSSMPAVDIRRHRYEINLANFAMNKIQNRAIEELIDPTLGFNSDPSIERMITSVAEVAFRCLQLEKEMRPFMDEVLDTLIEIRDYTDDKGRKDMGVKPLPHSPEADHAVLLKTYIRSPDSVADKWVSATTSISNG